MRELPLPEIIEAIAVSQSHEPRFREDASEIYYTRPCNICHKEFTSALTKEAGIWVNVKKRDTQADIDERKRKVVSKRVEEWKREVVSETACYNCRKSP